MAPPAAAFIDITDMSNHSPSRLLSSSTSKKKPSKARTSSPLSSDAAPLASRVCTAPSCHTLVAADARYKFCDPCRTRNREESRRYREKKQRQGALATAVASASEPVLSSATAEDAKPGKRKASDILERVTQKKLKTTGVADAVTCSTIFPVQKSPGDTPEYQFAGQLHSALRVKMRYRIVKERVFHGMYAIVSKPGVALERRIALVQVELRKLAKLRLGPVKDVESGGDFYIARYPCECTRPKIASEGTAQAQSTDPTPSANLKSKDTGLDRWMSNSITGVPCGGEVVVECREDISHPHFRGNRITLKVSH